MKRFFLLFYFIFFIFSCKNPEKANQNNRFRIKCVLTDENIFNKKIAFLKMQELGNLVLLDSTTIIDGIFEFNGTIDRPVVCGIYIESMDGLVGLFLENSEILIEIDPDHPEQANISGSKTNDEYLEFMKNSNKIVSKMNELFPVFQKARAENNVEKLEEINAKMQAINNENTAYCLNYARKNPDSYVAAVALHSILTVPTANKDTIAKIYLNFSKYVKQGDFAIQTAIYLENFKSNDSLSIKN